MRSSYIILIVFRGLEDEMDYRLDTLEESNTSNTVHIMRGTASIGIWVRGMGPWDKRSRLEFRDTSTTDSA
jgi:hypothetical protein